MIRAYLAGIPTLYEGEDIEVRYSIYENEELLCKQSIMLHYRKPAIVGQVALMRLLKELKKHIKKEITIIINDPALNEVVRGTSTTENQDVIKMAKKMGKELNEFDSLVIKDVSGNRQELMKWSDVLRL